MDDAELRAQHARMRTFGVTGTNGKTTTTHMIAAIMAAAGHPPITVSTLGSFLGEHLLEEGTTLLAFVQAIRVAAELEAPLLALELTSKALQDGFAYRWPVDIAIMTNFSRDHLDYHGTPEDYLAAKAQMFMSLRPGGIAVFNRDDAATELLQEVLPARVTSAAYACGERDADLAIRDVRVGSNGTEVSLRPGRFADELGGRLDIGCVGRVFAFDAVAAALATRLAGLPASAIRQGLAGFGGVPGRFQIVGRQPMVVVDYAHTPAALEATLKQATALTEGDVWVVFGCGGQRDAGKRGSMGEVAAANAQRVVLTSDNPRSEPPGEIIDAIAAGVMGEDPEFGDRMRIEPDRRRAIAHAVRSARKTDCVVIAGKGHERVQEVGVDVLPFSDVDAARAEFERREKSNEDQ